MRGYCEFDCCSVQVCRVWKANKVSEAMSVSLVLLGCVARQASREHVETQVSRDSLVHVASLALSAALAR